MTEKEIELLAYFKQLAKKIAPGLLIALAVIVGLWLLNLLMVMVVNK